MVPHAGGGWFQNRVRTSEDLRGLRIRASGIAAQLYRRLGAEVLDLSFADTLLAMESGLLAGAQLSAPHVDLALGVATIRADLLRPEVGPRRPTFSP